MTRNRRIPGFLVETDEGWRVDTGHPEWAAYTGQTARRALPQKVSGNRVKAAKGKARGRDTAGGKEADDEAHTPTSLQKAIEAKVIYNARREKLKMEQDEIKTGAMKEAYVVKEEGQYWLSFIQRGITGGFGVVRRLMPEVKRLILAGEDAQAEKQLTAALKAAWEQTENALNAAFEGEEEDDDGG